MLFLALFSCGSTEDWYVTYVGGGSATATLSGLEGWSDVSFEVPGLSEDQLDDLLRDGQDPNLAGALMTLDPKSFRSVEVRQPQLGGFEPCGLSLTDAYLDVDLDGPREWVYISGSPPTDDFGVHNVFHKNEVGVPLGNEDEVQDWQADEYAGSASVEVEVTCPEGAMTGLLQLEWEFDADVMRQLHVTIKHEADMCMWCYG